jgi:hypothetical protein
VALIIAAAATVGLWWVSGPAARLWRDLNDRRDERLRAERAELVRGWHDATQGADIFSDRERS